MIRVSAFWLLSGLIGFFGFQIQEAENYYYAFDEKVLLTEIDTALIVQYSIASNMREDSLTLRKMSPLIKWERINHTTSIVSTPSKAKSDEIVREFKNSKYINSVYPLFKLRSGTVLGLTNEFIVKYKTGISTERQEKLNKGFGAELVKSAELYNLLKVPKGGDALEISRRYQESGLVEFSHPNFLTKITLGQQSIPNDPYFNKQFALHNTGQVVNDGHTGTSDADIDAPECWPLTLGSSSITIAVTDDGITSNHPDLPNSRQVRLNGSNFEPGGTDPNDPSPGRNRNHGNACAGVIAASRNNSQGIAGLCPNCKIMPVKIINTNETFASPDKIAEAINFAKNNGADIISNSWFVDADDNPNLFPVIVSAIQSAITSGRGGLGCVVLFCVGNTASHAQGNNGTICFPSNVNLSGVLTVAASDRYDKQADYSPTGNPGSSNNQLIDIVAPSHKAYPSSGISGETFEAWTIDIPPDNNPYNTGHNPWPEDFYNPGQPAIFSPPAVGEVLPSSGTNYLAYTGRFGGTSHSTAVVSGVAALMLSANPNLTQQQVSNIITGTADKVGGYSYSSGRSNQLGFGRVNACKAVLQAYNTGNSIGGPGIVCSTATYSLSYSPNASQLVWTSSNNNGLTINPTTGFATRQNNFNGQVTIKATINSACGSVNFTKNVYVGNYLPAGISSVNSNCSGSTFQVLNTSLSGACTANTPIYFSYNITDLNYSNFVFTPVSVPSGATWSFSGRNLYMTVNAPSFQGSRSATVALSASGPCGAYNVNFTSTAVNYYSSYFSLSPNPSSESVTIRMDNQNLQDTVSQNLIYQIKITDNIGGPKKSLEYKTGISSVNLSLDDFSPGLYILSVFDGQTWGSEKLVVQK